MPQATIDNTAQFKHDMLVDSNIDEFAASVNRTRKTSTSLGHNLSCNGIQYSPATLSEADTLVIKHRLCPVRLAVELWFFVH